MRLAEATGNNLEEAIENGLKTLRVRREEVEYETISEVEGEVKIKMEVKEPRQHLLEVTKYILETSGFKPSITITKDDKGFYMNIKTRHADAILIGKKGETLWALQYIITRLMKRFHPNLKVLIDVSGYRMRRTNFLKKKAEAIARIVLQTGREMALDPLTKREKQIVELKLSEIKGVKIYSIGKGASTNVIIAPSDEST